MPQLFSEAWSDPSWAKEPPVAHQADFLEQHRREFGLSEALSEPAKHASAKFPRYLHWEQASAVNCLASEVLAVYTPSAVG